MQGILKYIIFLISKKPENQAIDAFYENYKIKSLQILQKRYFTPIFRVQSLYLIHPFPFIQVFLSVIIAKHIPIQKLNNQQQNSSERMEKSKPITRSRTRQAPQYTKHSIKSIPSESKTFDSKLYQKFVNFLTRTKLQKLKERLTHFYGRNFPIDYQEKYNFAEEWQGSQKKEQKNLYELIQSENVLVRIVCLFVMLTNTFLVWLLTIERIFKGRDEFSSFLQPLMVLGMINRVAAAALKLYLDYISSKDTPTIKIRVVIIVKETLSLLYFIGCLDGSLYDSPLMMVVELLIEFHLYLEAKEYYKYFRISELSLIYEYQFKIIDLMINLFILTHYLSILLYLGTFYDSGTNWIHSINADHQTFLGKYLYSLYFCCTTILTIGYGDVTPKNKAEIIIVIIIQYFGVIIFGYLINQIGHTLSVIRTNEENLQKDLTTLKKIQNFYHLQSKLSNKAKGFLVANQNATVELTPDEENNLLSKLNEDLRTTIINQKSLSIVKSSIFFLCRWSKDMQTHVASKLQKALYAPNERLLQPVGKERIYLIKRGKIDIYCDRFGHNRKEYRRLLKTIRAGDGNTISENIYGYTAVISLRPSALDAISSEFTSCFFIDREAFLKCTNNSQVDFQYFHQIKNRIDQSEFCQAYEAPSMLNIREHYNPSRTILIRKNKAQMAKLKNQREPFVRGEKRKMQKYYFKNLAKIIQDINDKIIFASNDYVQETIMNKYDQVEDNTIDVRNKNSEKEIEEEIIRGSHIRKKSNTIIRTLDIININSINTDKTDIFMPIIKKAFHHYFERSQEYKNFFFNNNLSQVIKSLQNENYNYNKKINEFLSIKIATHSTINFGFGKKSNH